MGTEREPILRQPYHETVTTETYHEAMSRLGAAVSIVTTDGPAGRCGLTVSSVTSVSDHPPIVLTCINQNARTCEILTRNSVFAVNVLGAGSETLSNAFAGRHGYAIEERFAQGEWCDHIEGTGAPVLHGSRVTLDCKVVDRIDSGTHRVFFGQVIALHFGGETPALLYLDRGYRAL
ncbi:flavin reductase family protein [Amorphus sp. 3PC139-8]|uniref:flavin reductase family protein n=1 Tax=Amorphus sp. 3PC139-8 TaxID=2735676 RepID=UPI00345DD812